MTRWAGVLLFVGAVCASGCVGELSGTPGGEDPGGEDDGDDAAAGADASPGGGDEGGGDEEPTTSERYRAAVMEDAPIGYWRLAETSGTVAKDEMGQHDGTYQAGVELGATGVLGPAARFGGTQTSGYVMLGNDFDFPGNVAFSIEAWVRWEGNDSRGPIFEKTSYVDLDPRGYRFEQLGNGIDLYVQGDGDADTYTRNEPMATGAYIHAVVTFDGTTYRLYRDGVLSVSETAQGTATSSAGGVGIGGNTEDGDSWKGLLQEVAVYDHALSAERIQAHFAIAP